MQNQFLILQNRTRRNPNTGRTHSFVKGERTTWTKLRKAGFTNVPEFVTPLSDFQVKALQSNLEIDKANKVGIDKELTPVEVAQIEIITEYLLNLGLDRSEFAFGKDRSLVYQNAHEDSESVWIGVKLTDLDGRFLRNTDKPVTLCKGNWISTNTFIYRVENNLPLFVRNEA